MKRGVGMIGLISGIIIFNIIAFKTNKKLKANQIVQIWTFTMSFQMAFDCFIIVKYHGYWYFQRETIELSEFLPHMLLVPPVNMMFLNWFPYKTQIPKQIIYIVLFVVAIILYEALTLLPEPWGYFNNGWWKLWYSAILDPFLLLILLGFYKWICYLEKRNSNCGPTNKGVS